MIWCLTCSKQNSWFFFFKPTLLFSVSFFISLPSTQLFQPSIKGYHWFLSLSYTTFRLSTLFLKHTWNLTIHFLLLPLSQPNSSYHHSALLYSPLHFSLCKTIILFYVSVVCLTLLKYRSRAFVLLTTLFCCLDRSNRQYLTHNRQLVSICSVNEWTYNNGKIISCLLWIL